MKKMNFKFESRILILKKKSLKMNINFKIGSLKFHHNMIIEGKKDTMLEFKNPKMAISAVARMMGPLQ